MCHLTRKLELASDIPWVIVVRGDISRKVSKYDLLVKINLPVERFTNPSEEYRSYITPVQELSADPLIKGNINDFAVTTVSCS